MLYALTIDHDVCVCVFTSCVERFSGKTTQKEN